MPVLVRAGDALGEPDVQHAAIVSFQIEAAAVLLPLVKPHGGVRVEQSPHTAERGDDAVDSLKQSVPRLLDRMIEPRLVPHGDILPDAPIGDQGWYQRV